MYIKLTGLLLSFLFIFSCGNISLKKDTAEQDQVVENFDQENYLQPDGEEEISINEADAETTQGAEVDLLIGTDEAIEEDEEVLENDDIKPAQEEIFSPEPGINAQDYEIQISALNTEITQLRSELDYYTEMLKDLNAKSSVWGNPFSVYNKEIILSDGTTLYGKIVYQDQDILKIETLIGGMVIPRSSVVRVVQNITKLNEDGSPAEDTNDTMSNNFEEINNPESGISLIERKKNSRKASLQMIGEISDNLDGAGNRIITGTVKNTGTQRADFSRITFTVRKNWEGDVFRENAWINGTTINCPDNNASSNSLLPNATGRFTLIIPASKGDIIGYTHDLYWEQMDNCTDAE